MSLLSRHVHPEKFRRPPPAAPPEPAPAPPPAVVEVAPREPEDPALTAARASHERALGMELAAERGYADDPTPARWQGVVDARTVRERAAVVLRGAAADDQQRRQRLDAERRAVLRAQLTDATRRASDEVWREELAPLLARVVAADLALHTVKTALDEVTRAQNAAAFEATRLARELGETAPQPKARHALEASQLAGQAMLEGRIAAGLPHPLRASTAPPFYAQRSDADGSPVLRKFFDAVLRAAGVTALPTEDTATTMPQERA